MTTAQTILTDAIARSAANDAGSSELASDQAGELLRVLSRLVRRVYALAGLPAEENGWGASPYFLARATVTVPNPNTTPVLLPSTPELVQLVRVADAGGLPVSIGTVPDLLGDTLDFPPAVAVANGKLQSGARLGDPLAGDVLTCVYAYCPPMMTALTDTIGATTPALPSTSAWPSAVGDAFLIDAMALYLAIKDNGRADAAALEGEVQASAALLGSQLGVNAARLAKALDA